jgi:hypothetical protein
MKMIESILKWARTQKIKSIHSKLYRISFIFISVITIVYYSVFQMTSKGNGFIREFAPSAEIIFDVHANIISGYLSYKEYSYAGFNSQVQYYCSQKTFDWEI